jgi:hypothetical protein
MKIRFAGVTRSGALAALLLAALPAWPQAPEEKPKPEPKKDAAAEVRNPREVQRIFELRHADPRELQNLLAVFPVRMFFNQHFKTVSVSGSPEVLAAVEETIKRFDHPPRTPPPPPPAKNVELTVHLLLGQEQGPAETIPAALQPVVAQLTGLFPYKSYRLAETMVVRSRDGAEGHVSGVLRGTGEGSPQAPYRFSYKRAIVGHVEKERQIRLDNLELVVDVPSAEPAFQAAGKAKEPAIFPVTYKHVVLKTDIDAREGQKVVVGKATLDGAGQALILVVTARVVD